MLYFALSCAQIALFLDMLRRLPATSAAVLCAAYVMMTQVYFIYRAAFFDSYRFPVGSYGSFYYRTEEGVVIYACIFGLIYLSTVGLTARTAVTPRRAFSEDTRLHGLIGPASLVILAATLTRLMTIDPAILWYNNEYLLIGSRAGLLVDNPIFALLASIVSLIMLIAGVAFACAVLLRRWVSAAILAFCLLILSAIAVAGASRNAAIPAASVAVTLFLLGTARHRIWAALMAVACLGTIAVALIGRSTDELGISSIPRNVALLFSEEGRLYVEVMFLNLSQGIFVTTDSIYIGGAFPDLYKWLSFSPFPSAIDGFDGIRHFQVRLHSFVPMSAIGEVYNFGWPWMVWFAAVLGLLFRANAKLDSARYPFIAIVSSLLIFVYFVMANAYPMRNVFRQFLVAYLVVCWPVIWPMIRRPLARTWPRARRWRAVR